MKTNNSLQQDILDFWANNITWAEFKEAYAKEHRAWQNRRLLTSCVHHIAYKNYGGRGITMQADWVPSDYSHNESRKAFLNFLQDVGPAPFEDATIDRIDSNGNYEKSNVRWVSMTDNARNRRDAIKLNGVSLKVICEEKGLNYYSVMHRFYKFKKEGMEEQASLSKAIKMMESSNAA